jgi:type III secretion system FlhB-like substrate exporter
MKMKRILTGILLAAVAIAPVFAQDTAEKPKKKMPSRAMYFTSLKTATKEAVKYDAPIFVVAVGKGSPAEAIVKKLTKHKFFQELASKGFFVYTMRVNYSKKEKDIDGRSPKPLYEKLSAEDQALLDVICPPDMVRKLPVFGMVTPDAKELKIKPVDMPRPPSHTAEYYGQYLQNLQSAAQAYGIDIEMSKALVKYIENPPAEKKSKKR